MLNRNVTYLERGWGGERPHPIRNMYQKKIMMEDEEPLRKRYWLEEVEEGLYICWVEEIGDDTLVCRIWS